MKRGREEISEATREAERKLDTGRAKQLERGIRQAE